MAEHVLEEAAVPVQHPAHEPFDESEVEAIVEEFQEFLATATPQDFEMDPGADEPDESDPEEGAPERSPETD